MFAGLLITFLVAMFGYTTGTIIYVFAIPYAYLVLGVAEIAVVIFLSARISKMSVACCLSPCVNCTDFLNAKVE